jgi:hypothetical protein
MKTCFAFTLASLAAAVSSAASQCQPLTDPNGNVWTELEAHFGADTVTPVKAVAIEFVASINAQFDLPLDTCLGSFDVQAAIQDIEPLFNSKSCNAAYDYGINTPSVQELQKKSRRLVQQSCSWFECLCDLLARNSIGKFPQFLRCF